MISDLPILNSLAARLRQGHRTTRFPQEAPALPERLRGRPQLDSALCPAECHICSEVCPTDAIEIRDCKPHLDLGRCLFCPECTQACPENAIQFTKEYRLATSTREALVLNGKELELARALDTRIRRIFGRSLKLRQVSAGGCNGCESDVNALGTITYDLGRFGIQFVASPRHADGLLITGPVTANMREALGKTYEAIPTPKLVIAVGACAISGGPFINHPQQHNGVNDFLPVDLYIPGCPPHPFTILDGLLRWLGRLEDETSRPQV